MSLQMADWEIQGTSSASDWPLSRLLRLKGDRRIAVVIPARNEEKTVGAVVRLVAEDLGGLVDELVVMDSLSTDGTVVAAQDAGARVHSVADVRPDLGVRSGKGEALWKSLFVTTSELLVFIDADLTEWGSHFVSGLLGPLLDDPSVQLVRGFYDRVLQTGDSRSLEGGRVTELVARPWLALYRPELAGIVQPLAGEWAVRRAVLEMLPVPVGYGVEFSTLLDVHSLWGVDAIAQVDLGRRAHRHQSLHDLTAMAIELLATGELRRGRLGSNDSVGPVQAITTPPKLPLRLPEPDRSWSERAVVLEERPPANGVKGYR